MAAHVGGHDIADRQKVGAAMVIDDALGVAGRARSVIERDRVPFVERRDARVILVAGLEEIFVFDLADALARPRIFGIVVVDDEWPDLRELQRLQR